ncbi:unnamed protein product [Sphagnum jensenii]|uniref:Uncharacterized protein n=1 Tax=Sphagnum jensenii TaxID=128206 RepID=A0ABP0XDD8_9BRYO
MSVMAAAVVREMGIMHLVIGSESYKTASGVVTQALGRIDEVAIRKGPGVSVEVLPLTTVNLLQNVQSKIQMKDATVDPKLTLQDQTDEFMKEELSDSDDYADWIQWVSDEEERRACSRGSVVSREIPVVLQTHRPSGDESSPRQASSSLGCSDEGSRWADISQKIRVDQDLGEEREQQLWKMLGNYQDVFAWNKKELGCCTIGEHNIDTQGFPPCNVSPGRLSFWEETEVKRQIGIQPDPGKIQAVVHFPTPRSVTNVRSFLGLTGYYRNFKIMHRPGLKHANADALSRNPVGSADDDDDFGEGIQDAVVDQSGKEQELLYIRKGEETEWVGVMRKDTRFIQHDACCFGINHKIGANQHHLFMFDAVAEEDQFEELTQEGMTISGQDAPVQQRDVPAAIKRKRSQYFGKQQQL